MNCPFCKKEMFRTTTGWWACSDCRLAVEGAIEGEQEEPHFCMQCVERDKDILAVAKHLVPHLDGCIRTCSVQEMKACGSRRRGSDECAAKIVERVRDRRRAEGGM